MRLVPREPCLALVREFEGDKGQHHTTRAKDPVGNWEIGWSHKLSGPDDPLWDSVLDRAEADALALEDLGKMAKGICTTLKKSADDLTDNQFAAVIDFAYNLGLANFRKSSLCRYLKGGNHALAYAEFPKWKFAGHPPVEYPGLVRRRKAEQDVWRTP